jgi:hypothetical protein
MKPITQYQADDGSIWDTPEHATAQDHACRVVAEILLPLGPRHKSADCSFENGHGYIRHDPATVAGVRSALLAITRKALAWWFADHLKRHGFEPIDAHCSWFCRMLEGHHDGPIVDAWHRLGCIDKKGREWGQVGYADDPEKGEAFEIDRTKPELRS